MPLITHQTPFGHSLTGDCLFSVNAGIPIKLALELAAQLLSSATVLCAESQVASPQTSHSLTFASLQLVEMSKGLVDATLDSVLQAAPLK
ncbi:DUF3077 domain-containing protein [Pseudomonas helleri]|uniref:DUF3077 domain-containing protein n=1 Tax=Pseudomonas helleri TaxID=1608996 RepID=UPI0037F1EDDE